MTAFPGYGGASDIAGSVTEGTTGAIGYGAFVGAFDRDQEYEADQIGLMLMAKAGYDPKRAIPLWERADEIFGSDYGSVEAFFSTHPASSDRAEALREALPMAEKYYQEALARNAEVPKQAKVSPKHS